MVRSARDGLRDRWRLEVYRHPGIGDACRVLLLKLADTMTDRGVVSVPQQRLADELGIDLRRVKARIAEAREAGLLDKLGGGYRGRTAEYIAVLGTAERHPITGKGAVFRHPKNVTLSQPNPALMGTAERPPNARALVTGTRERVHDERDAGANGTSHTANSGSEERAPHNSFPAAVFRESTGTERNTA